MNTLSRHIEALLLDHDCVIVQGFGGFIAVNKPARYVEEDGIFYPPYKSVTFNQHLTDGDGLLTQLYMQTYDASYPQALLQIEKDVEEISRELDLNGSVAIGGIGMLHKDLENRISLTTEMAGIDSPKLFGLASLNVEKWSKKKETPVQVIPMPVAEPKTQQKEHHIPFMYDMSVAAAIAAIFFLLFTAPMSKTTHYEEAYIAGIGQSVVSNTEEELNTEDYTIILASYVSEKNAKHFIENLKNQGFADAEYVDGKVTRVKYGSYATEAEAMRQLSQLKGQNSAFAEGWIMQLK